MTTIADARNAKSDLERQVSELLVAFEKQTGLEVSGINGRRVFTGSPGEGEFYVSLVVELK